MLTRCPSCQTTFKVTSDILRVADGQVRCGRCQYQFNALLYLQHTQGSTAPLHDADARWDHDEEPSIASRLVQPPRAPSPAPPDNDGPPAQPTRRSHTLRDEMEDEPALDPPAIEDDIESFSFQHDEAHPDIASDFSHAASPAGQARPADENAWSSQTATAGPTIQGATRPQRQPPAWVTANQASTRDDFAEQQLIDQVIADTIAEEDARLEAQAEEIIAERRHRAAWRDDPPAAAQDEDELDGELDLLTQPHQSTSILWKLLALPLVALLIAQATHNYRATLARHPQLGEPLQQIYTRLGLTLRPDWDLHAYEVRQWGVIADPATPGTLVVRASIKNLATYAQPYPQLKLMLEDRWGEQVRARAFEPPEYLDALVAPERLLTPGQQANATIAIVDPGPDAEGFRFDVCLRGAHGIVCAADLPRR